MVANDTKTNLIAVDFDPFAGPDIAHLAPITESQAEIWTSCQLGGNDASRAYNESVSLRFTGLLDLPAFKRALQALVDRHEALRSVISGDGSQVCVFSHVSIEPVYQDCSRKTEAEQHKIIADYVKEDALYQFDLLNGPLVKFGLLKLTDTLHHVTLTAHHIVCDGWSVGILLQDLSTLYSAYAQGTSPKLPPAERYSHYAAEQLTFAHSDEYRQIEQFWVDQYKQSIPVLNVPTDFPRPARRGYKSSRRDFQLSEELALATRQMGVKAGCSLVTTLMVVFEAFLHRLTGQDDIVVGLPAAGQSATGHLRLVGHCVNLLPLRSSPRSDYSFLDFLKQRKEEILDAYDHQQLTFGSLLKKLPIHRDPARVPLVPVIFNVDMGLDDGVDFYGLTYEFISNPREYETVDLFLNIGGSASALTFEWSYNTQLFNEDTIGRMMAEFERLLQAVVANPGVRIGAIPLTNQNELLTTLAHWNATQSSYPKTTPLHQLLSQTATEYPDKPALIVNEQVLSYQSLHETANRLAQYIQRRGAGPGSIVGVALDRSPELIIALLAVLKTGAAYVPLDPDYPHDRLAFMLADSSADMLITSRRYAGRMENRATEVLVETALAESADYPTDAPTVAVTGSDLAYILYTSGSTGRPKGVLIEHQNLVNLLYSMITMPGITSDDALLAVTTVSFDIAGLELFLPLLVGATLVLADAQTTKDGRALLEAVSEPTQTGQRVTIIQATPATYKMMLAAGWEQPIPLKVLCCGEPMSKDLAQKLTARCGTLWNMYGPTETTIYSTGKQILATDEVITIGRPIHNTQVYILDEQLNPLPAGIVGEIYLAGDGVARGYLNRPELTADKFVPNPFGKSGRGTMYRTGDLGKFMADGEIHCLGRIDHQVKVRGYRIELGEIEHALVTQNGIKEALVMAREDRPDDQRLTAYVVTSPLLAGDDFNQRVPRWKANLQDVLPAYMVPPDFVSLAVFPVTPNGKIDRNALPKPALLVGLAGADKPVTDLEKQLAAIWTEALGVKKISVDDSFFELGGHSMLAVQVMTRLEKETGRRLPLSALFEYPTIKKLASLFQTDTPAKAFKSLVSIKSEGSKAPIYVIHGIGLNLLNFSSLMMYMDDEQPIYGLQARGLDGTDEPLDSMEAIAAAYNAELLEQNPVGPYAIAGYSFGGYVALEMARQLKAMGKDVKMLAMFDTNAEVSTAQWSWQKRLIWKATRQLPKMIWIGGSFIKNPTTTLRYQQYYFGQLFGRLLRLTGLRKETQSGSELTHLNHIMEKHETAFQNYTMKPYDGVIDLFRAEVRPYFIDDRTYLGWKKYALKGVRIHPVPGDHQLMMLPPNDKVFARTLQKALDTC